MNLDDSLFQIHYTGDEERSVGLSQQTNPRGNTTRNDHRTTTVMATMSVDQFAQLMAFVRENTAPPPLENNTTPAPPALPRNDPSALGPMAPCSLGTNKMTKLTKFEEWLEEAENRMEYIGNQEDKDKIKK